MPEALTSIFETWLAPVRQELPDPFTDEDAKAFQQAVLQEALRRFSLFLKGIQTYQNAPEARGAREEVAVLWEKGTTRLLDYAPGSDGEILLVVPSLVNRFEILDIDPERSFLSYFAAQGFHPIVVDWQEPGEEERGFDLERYLTQRLLPILDFVTKEKESVHLLGYCMGGTMALALALHRQEKTKSLTLLAAPWDFGVAGVGGVPSVKTPVGQLFCAQAEKLLPQLESVKYLPPDFLQAVFTAFQPIQMLQKFMSFAGLEEGAAKTRRFVLTEDWLNSGVPLPLPVARDCLMDWYRDNLTAKMAWKQNDKIIDPRHYEKPTYILIAKNDRIVPPASTRPLARLMRRSHLYEADMGHIGLMTGDAAPQKVWEPLAAWLKALA